MRKRNLISVAVLIAAAVLMFGLSEPAQSQRAGQLGAQKDPLRTTLKGRIAIATKLPEAEVVKVLEAIGPAVRDLIGQGQQVEVPNLGTFRVVRIPEHRGLNGGLAVTIPGSNYVEFLPFGVIANAANQPGVMPAETVPPFEYNPLPDQTKSLKTENLRVPGTRTP